MKFATYGPFEIPRTDRDLVTRDVGEKREFWTTVDIADDGLAEACGCYIFTLQPSGGGAKPWHVGMTGKLGFRGECFQPHKVNLYNDALVAYDKAHSQLFLIAKLAAGGSAFAEPSSNGHADVCALEEVLIGIAYAPNRDLLSIRGTKFLREVIIPGVINSPPGKPGKAASALRKVLGL